MNAMFVKGMADKKKNEMETKLAEKITQATALMDKAREWFGSDMSGQPALTTNLIGQMVKGAVTTK